MKMELVDGSSLIDMIQDGQEFTEARVKKIIHQILEALAHLHSHNIIHHDIKCGNIMLTRNDTVKLLDFGLCNR
jgi:serine/threonine protein kinase